MVIVMVHVYTFEVTMFKGSVEMTDTIQIRSHGTIMDAWKEVVDKIYNEYCGNIAKLELVESW